MSNQFIDKSRLRQQLSAHESRRNVVYDDANGKAIREDTYVRGVATIGVGRNLVHRGLSEDEIDYLLDNDIADAQHDAGRLPFFARLDGVRAALIVELVFNLGMTRLRSFTQFLKAMDQGDFSKAAAELKDSAWYRQVGTTRGDRLVKQCESGEWQP